MIDEKKTKKSKGGRPKIELTPEKIKLMEDLASIQCTDEEIAAALSVSIKTFYKWKKKKNIREVIERGRLNGRISLRRVQFKQAQKNTAMAIFLGKNWLGQSDKVEHRSSDTLEKIVESLDKIEIVE